MDSLDEKTIDDFCHELENGDIDKFMKSRTDIFVESEQERKKIKMTLDHQKMIAYMSTNKALVEYLCAVANDDSIKKYLMARDERTGSASMKFKNPINDHEIVIKISLEVVQDDLKMEKHPLMDNPFFAENIKKTSNSLIINCINHFSAIINSHMIPNYEDHTVFKVLAATSFDVIQTSDRYGDPCFKFKSSSMKIIPKVYQE